MATQVISFNCLLKNKAGKVISSTYNHDVLTLIEDDERAMLYGLAKGLQDLKEGDKKLIELSAEQAYGLYDPEKVILYPRKLLPKDIILGQAISIVGKSGTRRHYTVDQFFGDMVRLDGNHPLAGQDLVFEVEVLAARKATAEEIDESKNPVSGQWLH